MIKRELQNNLEKALSDTPVVMLHGARQCGKTTLALQMASKIPGAMYNTLDDATTLAAAVQDPSGFVRREAATLIIDEVQRVPQLFMAIKQEVDRQRKPGRFLLTGSTNVLLLPKLSESLAGRIEILTLEPLARAEIEGRGTTLLQTLLQGKTPEMITLENASRESLIERVLSGGYPEVLTRPDPNRRDAWLGAYVTTILQRDVRDLANIEGLMEMPRLLSLLATRTANLLNVAEISRDIGLPHNTLKRYLSLLQSTFLIRLLPAWSRNLGKRLSKAPKILLNDTGLACHLLGIRNDQQIAHIAYWGRLVETFVVGELLRHASWLPFSLQSSHFRLATGHEVDLVFERGSSEVFGVEVKATATLRSDDVKGLRALADASGSSWRRGIVFYGGDTFLPFGPGMEAWPIASLWN